jgi:putative addiction module CopG family antidote
MSTDFLPSDLSQFVKAEVANGNFSSEEQVMIEGVQLLRERKLKLEELRAALKAADEEIERGEYTEYDQDGLRRLMEEIKQQGRREYEESQRQ